MNRARAGRLGAVLVTAFWVSLALWSTGPTMRESDQASLLQGAMNLVRNQDWIQNPSYNYDKQYLSYWVIAAWVKVRGIDKETGTLERLVHEGNLAAIGLFSLALMALVLSQRRWSWVQVGVLTCVLFSPVVAFTGVLLSPNMISAAWLLLLVVFLRVDSDREPVTSPLRIGLVGLLAWAATAARQDVILVIPLLALLAVPGKSLREFLGSRVFWAMAFGCLAAVALGSVLGATHTSLPKPFFVLPTFVTYLVGGLGMLLVLLFCFAGVEAWSRSWRGIMLGFAVILPLLFYACLLYTPRHLFIVALGLLSTVFFPRGWDCWATLGKRRVGRTVLFVALVGTILPWVVGVRMSSWEGGGLVARSSTLYPTADGFWPLGAYAWFYQRLGQAGERPLDHNQEVWKAWSQVDPADLPKGKGAVVSSGLVSYGLLAMAWWELPRAESWEDADYVLFDDRTLAKSQRGVDGFDGPNRRWATDLLSGGKVSTVGEAEGRRILLWVNAPQTAPDPSVSVTMALSSHFGGNDFLLSRPGRFNWPDDQLEGHRGAVVARDPEVLREVKSRLGIAIAPTRLATAYDPEPWWNLSVPGEDLRRLREEMPERTRLWLAVGKLPEFMDVREYHR
ncbi:MAG: hypothetical protein OSB65_07750 [Roseibacillus sp.]|nr:hypothetical protein [Roseibacillus sp.]